MATDTVCSTGNTSLKAARASLIALPSRGTSPASARTATLARERKLSSITPPVKRTVADGKGGKGAATAADGARSAMGSS